MSNVSVDSALIQQLIRNCSESISQLDRTRRGLSRKYQSLGVSWSDSKYQHLGTIVEECSTAISKVSGELQNCVQKLELLNVHIQEYESVNFAANSNGERELSQILQTAVGGETAQDNGVASPQSQAEIISRLNAAGVSSVNLSGIPLSVQAQIADAFESMVAHFPESFGCMSSLSVSNNMRNSTPASTGYSLSNGTLNTYMNINPQWFSSPDLDAHIQDCADSGQWAGSGVAGIINHELAHAMHLQLDANRLHWNIGDSVSGLRHLRSRRLSQCWMQNTTTNDIRDTVLNQMNLTREDVCSNISEYADEDGSECFAEAVADVTTSDNPSTLSRNIVAEYQRRYSALRRR